MKRFLIFLGLFPLVAMLVYVTPLVISEGFPTLDLFLGLLTFAYALAPGPALLTAGSDWLVSTKPLWLRVVVSAAVGASSAHLVAWYIDDRMSLQEFICVALAGAIPGALCSVLSSKTEGANLKSI